MPKQRDWWLYGSIALLAYSILGFMHNGVKHQTCHGQHAGEAIKANEPDAVVVGGDGLDAGVVDHLKHRAEFHGGQTPRDPNMYFNRRAEVWGLMVEERDKSG
jgi:hypothetical protein